MRNALVLLPALLVATAALTMGARAGEAMTILVAGSCTVILAGAIGWQLLIVARQQQPRSRTDHVDADDLVDLARGELEPELADIYLGHLDRCESCARSFDTIVKLRVGCELAQHRLGLAYRPGTFRYWDLM